MNESVIKALDALFQPANRSDTPGVVVGVAQHGKPVYRRAFGLASIEHGVGNTLATRMRIGSTSKHFACLAALLLVEEGKLDIDTGVRRYLPELPADLPEPTLRQFMTHTSGMRDSLDVGFLAAELVIKPKGESLAVQARQRGINFAPGDKMMYNNGGYHLLSLAIERVSGISFEQFLKERIFEPLGMLDTASVPSDFEIHPRVATMHVAQPDGSYRRGIFPSEEVKGEGAIISTVGDMLHWLRHLRGPHTVGSEESWKQMLAPARLNNGMLSTYSLGLLQEKYRGIDVIHHGGTVIGGTCQMLTVPEHALDIVILSNGAPVSVPELANKVIEAVLGEKAFPQPSEGIAASAAYRPLIGARYASPSADVVLGFGETDGKLGLIIHNSPAIPVREEDGALCLDFGRTVTGPYRVAIEGSAAPQTLQLEEAGTMRVLERLPDPPPALAEAGKPLVGRYRAPDLNAEASIAFEDDTLVLRIASEYGPNVLTLTPYSHDVFGWNYTGQLAPLGGTLHVESGASRVSGLRLNSLRTRNLHLERIDD